MKITTWMFLACWLFVLPLTAQDFGSTYRYKVDLNAIDNDEVKVELLVPQNIVDDEMTFLFPRIIPGTYEVHNFGRFVNQLKAFDRRGNELKVERKDRNTWLIKKAKRLEKITYMVEDTWDSEQQNTVFEPAGTNITDNQHFVINHNGFFGFFEGYEKLAFRLEIDRPASFYGSTSMNPIGGDFDTDIFEAKDYHRLVDAPIMYCPPDTARFSIGYGEILISVYSPNGKVKATDIKEQIAPILNAQREYLGGILPVEKYAFLINLSPMGYPSGSVGALEHSRSSFFCLTEDKPDRIAKIVKDISSHEFFHIVTPLFIHSEEIHYFDFTNPEMSKHLWLYEGVTEYAAKHVQVKYGLYSLNTFLDELGKKVRTSYKYKDGYSLVEMSENCLQEEYLKEYNNIYQKGAMTAMCLDLQLLISSNGEYDLQSLMRDLSQEYGIDKPFEDDKLFDKIVALTYPSVNEFIEKHIKGIERIPYDDFVNPFGINYFEKANVMEVSALGGIENRALRRDSLGRFYVSVYDRMDEFGTDHIGFQKGDVILEWNGKPFTPANISAILISYLNGVKVGDPLSVLVEREVDGEKTEVLLETVVVRIELEQEHVFKLNPEATEQQIQLREKWLGDYFVEE